MMPFMLLAQTIQAMQMPMFSAAGQSAIRTALSPVIEKKAEAEPSSDREKLRLLETIKSLEAREEEPTPSAKPAPKPQIAPPPNMPMPQEEVSAFEPLSQRAINGSSNGKDRSGDVSYYSALSQGQGACYAAQRAIRRDRFPRLALVGLARMEWR
jgi:hypothetical protein